MGWLCASGSAAVEGVPSATTRTARATHGEAKNAAGECCGVDDALPVRPSQAGQAHRTSGVGSDMLDQTKLLECLHAVIEPDLLDDLAVFETQHGRSREPHRATRIGRQ